MRLAPLHVTYLPCTVHYTIAQQAERLTQGKAAEKEGRSNEAACEFSSAGIILLGTMEKKEQKRAGGI